MTSMTPADIDNLGILDPDYMRRMGEPESSVEYRMARQSEPSLLEMFGEALRPNMAQEFSDDVRRNNNRVAGEMFGEEVFRALANLPAVDTGD